MDAFWAAPPITRTLAGAMFSLSLIVAAKLLDPRRLIFDSRYIFTIFPQFWRIVTSFCLTGGFNIIFYPYFIWQNLGSLEKDSPRFSNPGDLLMYLLFIGTTILVAAHWLFGSILFASTLLVAIAYTYAQENRGRKVNFFFVTLDVVWLPYAMLFSTLIMVGPEEAFKDSIGIPAAHLYDFLTKYWPQYGGGSNVIQTPGVLNRMLGGSTRMSSRAHGTAFRPPTTQTSTFSSSWGARGQGRRLGSN